MSRPPASARDADSRAAPAVPPEMGQRLRARREERGIGLRELARRLGLSPSALSQIETGKSRPSVRTLYTIVTDLGMSLDELFEQGSAESPQAAARRSAHTRRRPEAATERVQRAAARETIQLESGVRWERLTPAPEGISDYLYVTYEPGGSSGQDDGFSRHEGREYGLVLSGTLEITVGLETHRLGPGDSIWFDSTTPHRLRNNGPEPVRGIWLVAGGDPPPASAEA